MTTITLANLKNATEQEVFNQVVIHLVKQRVRSGRYEEDGHYGCYYRHPEDSSIKCAAGCLISDEEYDFSTMDSRMLNGTTWRDLVSRDIVPDWHSHLISSLQNVHDSKSELGSFTVDDFKYVAEEYSLQLPEVV